MLVLEKLSPLGQDNATALTQALPCPFSHARTHLCTCIHTTHAEYDTHVHIFNASCQLQKYSLLRAKHVESSMTVGPTVFCLQREL